MPPAPRHLSSAPYVPRTGDRQVDTIGIDGVTVEIYEVPHVPGDDEDCFYDLFVDGICINLGEPLWEYPTEAVIRETLR